MADKRDYYEVLGLQKGAGADEIKAAYRKAALKWHPDRWVSGTDQEKKTAEANFKEASEAYSVLSDPDKKAKYDQFGFAGMDGGAGMDWSQGFGNLNDILNNLFGGGGFGGFSGFGFGGGQQQSGPRVFRGRDIRTRVSLTLSEIAKGCEKEISIEREVPCTSCNGKGAKSEADIKTCPACKGTGQYKRVVNGFFGQTMQISTCQQCNGEGKVIAKACPDCGGKGVVRKRETFKVSIPAGVEDGMQLTMRGKGHAGKNNGPCGDLLIVIQEIEQKTFERDGSDLHYTKVISIPQAILGATVEIPCVDGTTTRVEVKPGTQSGETVRLGGGGLPGVNSYGKGDLYIHYIVYVPKRLSKEEKELVEKMSGMDGFDVNKSADSKSFLDKLKDLFRD